jgi:hypothetical protein
MNSRGCAFGADARGGQERSPPRLRGGEQPSGERADQSVDDRRSRNRLTSSSRALLGVEVTVHDAEPLHAHCRFTRPHDVSGTNRVSADIKTVRDP